MLFRSGALIKDVNQSLLLVTDPGKEEESIIRLSRVGFDKVLGHLAGGFESWKNSGKTTEKIDRISAAEFSGSIKEDSKVIDVRRENEYINGHVDHAHLMPLDDINEWCGTLDKDKHFFLHCQGGYRSMIAASILTARGINNFSEVAGGYKAISETNVPVSKGIMA